MNKFFATDPNGTVHTRTSQNRSYTHTVVAQRSYDADLQRALSKGSDANNFAYYTKIAEGNDPHPAKNYRALYPERYTAKEIAAEAAQTQAIKEGHQRDATAKVAGHTVESYCAALRDARVAQVEKQKAEGYYEVYVNLGWCGRPDLARALAGKNPGAVILEAQKK